MIGIWSLRTAIKIGSDNLPVPLAKRHQTHTDMPHKARCRWSAITSHEWQIDLLFRSMGNSWIPLKELDTDPFRSVTSCIKYERTCTKIWLYCSL